MGRESASTAITGAGEPRRPGPLTPAAQHEAPTRTPSLVVTRRTRPEAATPAVATGRLIRAVTAETIQVAAATTPPAQPARTTSRRRAATRRSSGARVPAPSS